MQRAARAPAVAMYIDDVYHATAVGSELDLADVDRVGFKNEFLNHKV